MAHTIPCKYYNSSAGCTRENCSYLHSSSSNSLPTARATTTESESAFKSMTVCKFFAKGYCRRGSQCYFQHPLEEPCSSSSNSTNVQESQECEPCSICFESPKEYGLLTGCNHIFCLTCIRIWRSKNSKGEDLRYSNVLNECPVCRAESDFIIPSVVYAKDDKKEPIINSYKLALSKIPCRHFFRSGPNLHVCPFNDNCFYSHNDAQGNRIPCKQRPIRSPLDPRIMNENILHSIRRMVIAQMNLDWDDIEDDEDDFDEEDEDDEDDEDFDEEESLFFDSDVGYFCDECGHFECECHYFTMRNM